MDAAALEHALRARIAGEVRFDRGTRAVYSADASNYRQIPIGVVIPETAEDVIAAVAVCREFGAPRLARGRNRPPCASTDKLNRQGAKKTTRNQTADECS